MLPVSPIHPSEVQEPEALITFCAPGVCQHEPRHLPLPVLLLHDSYGSIVTRWRFTDEERAEIAGGADLYLYLDTQSLVPPMLPTLQGLRFGPKCVECSHGRDHDRVISVEGGARELKIGCRFCGCLSGWRETEPKSATEPPALESLCQPMEGARRK